VTRRKRAAGPGRGGHDADSGRSGRAADSARSGRDTEPGRRGRDMDSGRGGRDTEPGGPSIAPILRDVLILAAVFGITVGVAELAGAASLGISFGIGQLTFVVALVVLLSRD
jgi:hypothetical protein